jgi:hypothetical protein
LNATRGWVMNITQTYLFEYDNSFLDLNTLNFSKGISSIPKSPPSDTWTEVHVRRRSKSPPASSLAPAFNPGPSPVRHKPQCHTKEQGYPTYKASFSVYYSFFR